ncbi:magnesium transporter [Atopobacter phocae]|uniref:magnesium transporter n=1 Tax=Atopobacter phocae TaxID=136492 RepID=UPI0004BC7D20|nr:magnesium transporter [Atopobacter phocae]
MKTDMSNEKYYQLIFTAAKKDERDTFRALFLRLHENDQVEVFHLLYPQNKAKITQFLSSEEFAAVFDQMDFEDRLDSVTYLPAHYMTEVFRYAADDNVTNLLNNVDEEQQQQLLEMMHPNDRRTIEKMLQHDADTAGAIMTTELIKVSVNDTADMVIQKMREIGRLAETIYYIYVVDEGQHLTGVISLRELILSPGETKVEQLMTTQVVTANVETDQEEVAHLIQEYDLLALPIVTIDNVLVGIVTVDDVIDILEDEATEDFHRFAGISTKDEDNEEAEESIWMMTRQRLPWILILLFMGLLSANLISLFEDTLAEVVALASFMPILTDSAGNVGTQSLAVSVRRLTMNSDEQPNFWTMLLKELCTGTLIGTAASLTIAGIALVMYHNVTLAFVIAISILVTLSMSTVIGYLVPALFNKLGIDPAVASGPFITTINDIFGLFIYFSMATALLHLL